MLSCEICKIFKSIFFTEHLCGCFLILDVWVLNTVLINPFVPNAPSLQLSGGVLKIFWKFTWKYLSWSHFLYFNKVAGLKFLWKVTPLQVCFRKFYEIFNKTFLTEHLQADSFVLSNIMPWIFPVIFKSEKAENIEEITACLHVTLFMRLIITLTGKVYTGILYS